MRGISGFLSGRLRGSQDRSCGVGRNLFSRWWWLGQGWDSRGIGQAALRRHPQGVADAMGYPLPRRGPTGAPGTQRGVPVHRNPTQPFLTGAQPLVVTLSGTLTQRLLRVISSPRRVAGRPKAEDNRDRHSPQKPAPQHSCSRRPRSAAHASHSQEKPEPEDCAESRSAGPDLPPVPEKRQSGDNTVTVRWVGLFLDFVP